MNYNKRLKIMLKEIQEITQCDNLSNDNYRRLETINILFTRLLRNPEPYNNLAQVNETIEALVRAYTSFDKDSTQYKVLFSIIQSLISNTSVKLHSEEQRLSAEKEEVESDMEDIERNLNEEIKAELVERDGDYYVKVEYDKGAYVLIGIDNETVSEILTNIEVNPCAPARTCFTIKRREILKFLENDTKIISERTSKEGFFINHYDYFAKGDRSEQN